MLNKEDLYNFSESNFLNWITAFCIFEIPLALFFLKISNETDTVTDWYSGKTISIWNVIAQDMTYALCGIIIALALFDYLVSKKLIEEQFLFFVIVLVIVQLTGDLLFANTMINWPDKYATKWINYFKTYINKSGYNALIGDSIWIISWALSYYFVSNNIERYDIKIFIISLFIFFVSAYSVR